MSIKPFRSESDLFGEYRLDTFGSMLNSSVHLGKGSSYVSVTF